jgi:hypothetical protein
MGGVVLFPTQRRRSPEDELRLEAAVEWLVTEVEIAGGCGVSIALLRELATRELARPRDSIHRLWAETFLRETEQYG